MVVSPASRSCSGQSSGRADREGVPCHTGAATGSIVTVEGARFLVEPPGLGVPGDDGEREGPVPEAASSPPCAWGLRKAWRSALRASEVRIGAPLGPCHAMAAAKALAPSPEAGRFHGGGHLLRALNAHALLILITVATNVRAEEGQERGPAVSTAPRVHHPRPLEVPGGGSDPQSPSLLSRAVGTASLPGRIAVQWTGPCEHG